MVDIVLGDEAAALVGHGGENFFPYEIDHMIGVELVKWNGPLGDGFSDIHGVVLSWVVAGLYWLSLAPGGIIRKNARTCQVTDKGDRKSNGAPCCASGAPSDVHGATG